jgi:hypothetical protein
MKMDGWEWLDNLTSGIKENHEIGNDKGQIIPKASIFEISLEVDQYLPIPCKKEGFD